MSWGTPEQLEVLGDKVFNRYRQRFADILWDVTVLTRSVSVVDLNALLVDDDEDFDAAVSDAYYRLSQGNNAYYSVYKFGLTFLWAEIESLINDFLNVWLTHMVKPSEIEVLKGSKASFTIEEMETFSKAERVERYVDTLKGIGGVSVKGSDIKTFFNVLDKLNLKSDDGETQVFLEKVLTEAQQVRNILVHKGGVVDARMMKACPWLEIDRGIKAKDTYPLNKEVFNLFIISGNLLAVHLLDRHTKSLKAEIVSVIKEVNQLLEQVYVNKEKILKLREEITLLMEKADSITNSPDASDETLRNGKESLSKATERLQEIDERVQKFDAAAKQYSDLNTRNNELLQKADKFDSTSREMRRVASQKLDELNLV